MGGWVGVCVGVQLLLENIKYVKLSGLLLSCREHWITPPAVQGPNPTMGE